MSLDSQAIESLAALGYESDSDLQFWRRLWDDEGKEFFWSYLKSEQKAAEDYRTWLPQLVEYADACRRRAPVLDVSEMTAVERKQRRILREAMDADDVRLALQRGGNCASIVSTSRVGLSAAYELFRETEAVILEETERRHWFRDIYRMELREGFRWFQFLWWTLSESVPDEDKEYVARNYTLPSSCAFWVVQTGWSGGPLAGGGRNDLWCWDGETAEHVDMYSVWNA